MDDKKRLKVLLEHWIEHNQEHGEEFRQWAGKARSFGGPAVEENILKAVGQLEAAGKSLKQALDQLK